MNNALFAQGLPSATAPWDVGIGAFNSTGSEPFAPGDMGAERDGASAGAGRGTSQVGGGRSLSIGGGGDPTSIGRAQEIGNLHLGSVPLNASYDFDNGGFHVATKDGEFSFGISGMTQVDGMLYARPTAGIDTTSGFYNPRSRIYFEGHATQPIGARHGLLAGRVVRKIGQASPRPIRRATAERSSRCQQRHGP